MSIARKRSGTGSGSLVHRLATCLAIAGVAAMGGLALAVAFPTRVAAAVCNEWSGAVNSNWSTNANWSLGTPVSGQSLCFPAGEANAQSMTDDIPGLSVTSLSFSDDRGNAISGDELTISGAAAQVSVQGLPEVVIDNALVVTGTTTIAGGVASVNGGVSGAGGFVVQASRLILGAAGTFSGGVDVKSGGDADVSASGGLGTGTTSVEPGGFLSVGAGTDGAPPVVLDNPMSLAGNGAGAETVTCWYTTSQRRHQPHG